MMKNTLKYIVVVLLFFLSGSIFSQNSKRKEIEKEVKALENTIKELAVNIKKMIPEEEIEQFKKEELQEKLLPQLQDGFQELMESFREEFQETLREEQLKQHKSLTPEENTSEIDPKKYQVM